MKVLELQTWIDKFGEDQLNVDKLKEYLEFVQKAEQSRDPSRYSEWHHVMPKCIDKESEYRDQGVEVNFQDHLKSHILLTECFVKGIYERRVLGYAVRQMTRSRDNVGRSLSLSEIEEVRIAFVKSVTGTKMSPESCLKISRTLGDGRLKGPGHPMYGKHHSDDTKSKISETLQSVWTEDKKEEFSQRRTGKGNPCYGKKLNRRQYSEEEKLGLSRKLSESGKNKIWINNGEVSTKISKGQEIPDGWTKGRLSFNRSSNGQEGKMWINNGVVNKKIPRDSDLPEGFVYGRMKYRENQVSYS